MSTASRISSERVLPVIVIILFSSYDPEASQVKFAEQSGLPVMYQTREGIAPHPWETTGGQPPIAVASTVDELVKQLPTDFDLESRPSLMFVKGQQAIHGWMEDGFAVIADSVVEHLPSDLMSFFGERLGGAGVSTQKHGIYRYGRTGEFYQKMGSLFADYETRMGGMVEGDTTVDTTWELGNVEKRLRRHVDDLIDMRSAGTGDRRYFERVLNDAFAAIPEQHYPRLDALREAHGDLAHMYMLLRGYDATVRQGYYDKPLEEVLKGIEGGGFKTKMSRDYYLKYLEAEESGFYRDASKLETTDAMFWERWNVENVVEQAGKKIYDDFTKLGFRDLASNFIPDLPFGAIDVIEPEFMPRVALASEAFEKNEGWARVMEDIVSGFKKGVDDYGLRDDLDTFLVYLQEYSDPMSGYEGNYILSDESVAAFRKYVEDADTAGYLAQDAFMPEGYRYGEGLSQMVPVPLISESAEGLAQFPHIRDLGVREYYQSTEADDFSWIRQRLPDDTMEALKQIDKWARESDVFFRITVPEDDLTAGGSFDIKSESVAHIVTQLGHDLGSHTLETAAKYLADMTGRQYGTGRGSGLSLAEGYVYSAATPEELYNATGGQNWGPELVAFRGEHHPLGISPHATVVKSQEILGRFGSDLVSLYQQKIYEFGMYSRGTDFSASSQHDLSNIFTQLETRAEQVPRAELLKDFVSSQLEGLEIIGDPGVDPAIRQRRAADFMANFDKLLTERHDIQLLSGQDFSQPSMDLIDFNEYTGIEGQENVFWRRINRADTLENMLTGFGEIVSSDDNLTTFINADLPFLLQTDFDNAVNAVDDYDMIGSEDIFKIDWREFLPSEFSDASNVRNMGDYNRPDFYRTGLFSLPTLDTLRTYFERVPNMNLAPVEHDIIAFRGQPVASHFQSNLMVDPLEASNRDLPFNFVNPLELVAEPEEVLGRWGGIIPDFVDRGINSRVAGIHTALTTFLEQGGLDLQREVARRIGVEQPDRIGREVSNVRSHYFDVLDQTQNEFRKFLGSLDPDEGFFDLQEVLTGVPIDESNVDLFSGREIPVIQPRSQLDTQAYIEPGRFYRVSHENENPFKLRSADWEATNAFATHLAAIIDWGYGEEIDLADYPELKTIDTDKIVRNLSSIRDWLTIPKELPSDFVGDAFGDFIASYEGEYVADQTLSYPYEGDTHLRREGIYAFPDIQDALGYARHGATTPKRPILSILEGVFTALSDDNFEQLAMQQGVPQDELSDMFDVGRTYGGIGEVVIEPERILGRYDLSLFSGKTEPVMLPSGLIAAEHMTEHLPKVQQAGMLRPAIRSGQSQLSTTGLHRFERANEVTYFADFPSYRQTWDSWSAKGGQPEGFAFDPEVLFNEFNAMLFNRDEQKFAVTAYGHLKDALEDYQQFELDQDIYPSRLPKDLQSPTQFFGIVHGIGDFLDENNEVAQGYMHDYLVEARKAYENEFNSLMLRGQDALGYLGKRSETYRQTGELPSQVAEILVPDDIPVSRAYGVFDEGRLQLMSGKGDEDINAALNDIANEIDSAEQVDFEDYSPAEFERSAFEGAEVAKPTGQASPFDFTPEQRAAIQHGTGRGLVVAGPGSGKTAVLRERMLNLVQSEGVDPQRILTLAFNKKAEQELIKRSRDIGKVQIKTIHGFANRIIRENIDALGFGYTPQVAEEEDQFKNFTYRLMAQESKTGQVNQTILNEVVSEVDRARAGVTQGLFDPSVLAGEAKRFAIAYETFKTDNQLIDFQDMLIHTANLLETRPDIAERYRSRFDYVQVDEFQDVSQVDYRYLSQLGENILAVGDDDQTIFGFRSGAGAVMQEFADTATQYNITENFRSTQNIVDLSKQLIEGAQSPRLAKDLFSQGEVGVKPTFVPSTPANLFDELDKQLPPDRETAILVRTNDEVRALWNKMPEAMQKRVATVQTMHSVKGLEFDRVIVLMNSLASGGGLYRSFPSLQNAETLAADLEEERRLLYVAMTRAKEELVLMGHESHFMPELGFAQADQPAPIEPVLKDQVKASKVIRRNTGSLFDRLRARYQRVRTYQDLVSMEKSGKVPIGEVIENLTATQVHREKIEALGEQLGIRPRRRDRRARRPRFLDRLLTLPARTGQIKALGIAGAGLADLATVDPFLAGGVGISGFVGSKLGRLIDEALYPLARRPEQQLFYEQLHRPLPDAVRGALPEGVDPTGFRHIESRLADPFREEFYEFPHPAEGWEGDQSQRPLYDEAGNLMNRISQAESEALGEQGRLSRLDTFIDTTESSANVRITPYDPIGGDPYRRPRVPREPDALQAAIQEHFTEWRGFLEQSRGSVRRPSIFRSPKNWRAWGRQHGRLTRGLDRFAGRGFDLGRANKLLGRLNRENIGSRFGGDTFELGTQTTRLQNEVMDVLDDVLNPASPYYGSPTQIMAGGRLHELPDGSMASGDPDPIYTEGRGYTRTPRTPIRQRVGQRVGGAFRRTPQAEMLQNLGLVIETFDEAGERVRIGSGSYLGKGRFGTALHNLIESRDGLRQSDIQRLGAADGYRDGCRESNDGLHFVSGCLLNVFAWLVIDNPAVPVPAGRLIGRPPAYVQAYTQSYQNTIQAERTKSMGEGCLINATVVFCLLPTYFVF